MNLDLDLILKRIPGRVVCAFETERKEFEEEHFKMFGVYPNRFDGV